MSDLKCDAEILINNIKSIVYKQTFRDHRTPKVYSEHFLKTDLITSCQSSNLILMKTCQFTHTHAHNCI